MKGHPRDVFISCLNFHEGGVFQEPQIYTDLHEYYYKRQQGQQRQHKLSILNFQLSITNGLWIVFSEIPNLHEFARIKTTDYENKDY